MTKLSDTQALILSAAAQRDDRIALPLPESLRGGAAAKVVGAMLAKGFLEEVDADTRKGESMWRETGDGHGVTLVATDAGLAAIGIEPEDANAAPTGPDDAPSDAPATDTATQPDPAPKSAHTAHGHEAGDAHRDAPRGRRRDHRRDHGRDRLAVAHGARRDGRALKKKLGLEVTSVKVENRGRVYKLPAA